MTINPKLMPARFHPDSAMQVPAGSPGFVLQERGRRHHWEGIGLLSIKSFSHGRALYDTGKGIHAVDESSYLILNDRQPYSISIESDHTVESFCIFFKAGFAEQVYYSLSSEQRKLLDNPEPPDRLQIGFFDKTYSHDSVLSPALLSLGSSYAGMKGQKGWLEEQLHELMHLLLRVRQDSLKEALGLRAVRASTREELYRRLTRAKDYISACFDQPVTLKEIASVACLSPNHLLRSFRQAFGQTPHEFLTQKRLEHAENARPVKPLRHGHLFFQRVREPKLFQPNVPSTHRTLPASVPTKKVILDKQGFCASFRIAARTCRTIRPLVQDADKQSAKE